MQKPLSYFELYIGSARSHERRIFEEFYYYLYVDVLFVCLSLIVCHPGLVKVSLLGCRNTNFLALGTVSATFLVLVLLQQRRSELILRNLLGYVKLCHSMAAESFTCTDDFSS